MISFFASLPEEIEESAEIDGATEFQLFLRIVLPLVLPGITAVAILSFMTSWNEYLYGVIFVQSPSNFTIPLSLSTLNSEQELAQWGSIAAGGIVSLIPIAIFVIFAQNFLIQGLSSGAVKE
jgi:multiple sugar transport system permease protein